MNWQCYNNRKGNHLGSFFKLLLDLITGIQSNTERVATTTRDFMVLLYHKLSTPVTCSDIPYNLILLKISKNIIYKLFIGF